MEYPDLLSDDKIEITKQLFPSDAIDRAKTLKKHIKSVGAYSTSKGILHIREDVAQFILSTASIRIEKLADLQTVMDTPPTLKTYSLPRGHLKVSTISFKRSSQLRKTASSFPSHSIHYTLLRWRSSRERQSRIFSTRKRIGRCL